MCGTHNFSNLHEPRFGESIRGWQRFPFMLFPMAQVAAMIPEDARQAAVDLGASTWTTPREVTIPLLAPGLVSAGLSAFVLSWGNFPLSRFTLGVDASLPKWLYARMVSGCIPLVPTVGMLSVAVSASLAAPGLAVLWLRGWVRRRAATRDA